MNPPKLSSSAPSTLTKVIPHESSRLLVNLLSPFQIANQPVKITFAAYSIVLPPKSPKKKLSTLK
jgi:hypothetical protein